MGIHDLLPFLRKNAPSAFKPVLLPENSTVAIDTPIYMYKFGYSVGSGPPLCSRMLQFANDLISRGYDPIFVFDGQNLPEKTRERAKRQESLCRQTQLKHMGLSQTFTMHFAEGDEEIEVERTNCPIFRPSTEDFLAFKHALDLIGIKSSVAQYEAEALCSHLCATGKVQAVLTEDSDSIAYLSPCVIFHWKGEKEEMANAIEACNALELTQTQFQDFCILLGNDFNDRIKGIGPVKALSMIRKYGSLERILDLMTIHEEIASSMRSTKRIFSSTCFESDCSTLQIT